MVALEYQSRTHDNGNSGPLVVIPALPACQGRSGSFILTRKFHDGVIEYVKHWPGRVIVCVERSFGPDTNLDRIEIDPMDVPYELEWLPMRRDAVVDRVASARLVLATLVDRRLHLARKCAELGIPIIYITEYTLQTRKQIVRAETGNPLLRWRRQWWEMQQEGEYKNAVRIANGIQCNGTPTYLAYRNLNRNPMLYFDTRVRGHQIVPEHVLRDRTHEMLEATPRRPLRLGFSGRLIAMKGVNHLPRIADQLRRLGVDFTMDICGAGPLEDRIRRDIVRQNLKQHVQLRGVLEFQRELLPFVSRNIDLFVCCHRQGDPSCTYLETMSCGVPIVGYDNEAFTGIVEQSGVGWLSPLNDCTALAKRIAELDGHRRALAEAAWAAREFAAHHTFENTMQVRIDHMLHCAQATHAKVKTS